MSSSTQMSVLPEAGKPLQILTTSLPSPVPASSAIVRMLIVDIANIAKALFSGRGPMQPPVPLTPGTGGVGVVETFAEDVFGLKPDDLVMVDPLHITQSQSRLLIGWLALSDPTKDEDAAKQIRLYKNGTWATRAVLPASCLRVIPSSLLHRHPSITIEELLLVKNICIGHGAVLASEFQAGDRVLVNGASGSYGGWVVLLLLVLNAGRVYVMGRNEKSLKRLVELDPQRVQAVVVQTDSSAEAKKETENAAVEQVKNQLGDDWQHIDRFIDFLGYAPTSDSTMAGIHSLRVKGFAIFSGGVQASISLPYGFLLAQELTIRGCFMYPQSSFSTVLSLLPEMSKRFHFAKLLAFKEFQQLEDVNQAVDAAVSVGESFSTTVIYPNSKANAKEEMLKRTHAA